MILLRQIFSLRIQEYLVDPAKYDIKCPYELVPEMITIHQTADDTSAANEVTNMLNNDREVSWHFGVDDQVIINAIPTNRNAWHAGDGGSGNGNRKSLAMEICYSKSGGPQAYAAEANGVLLTAYLMNKFNIPISKVFRHKDWSGKNCPQRILEEGRWESFLTRVQNAFDYKLYELDNFPIQHGYEKTFSIGDKGRYSKYVRMLMDDKVYSGLGYDTEVIGSFKAGNVVKVGFIESVSNGTYAGYIWGSVTYQDQKGYIALSHARPVDDY